MKDWLKADNTGWLVHGGASLLTAVAIAVINATFTALQGPNPPVYIDPIYWPILIAGANAATSWLRNQGKP